MSEKRKDKQGRILKTGESQRENGTYMYRFNDASGVRRCIYAKTLSELRAKEEEIATEEAIGMTYDAKKIKVDELVDMYLASKSHTTRDSTQYTYRRVAKRVKEDPISNKRVKDIKVSTAKDYLRRLADAGMKYSSIGNVKAFMKAAFDIAIQDSIILINPFQFSLRDVVAYEKGGRVSLSVEEQKLFKEFVANHRLYHKYYDDVCALLETGMRIGEYCALTQSDIDFHQMRIRIDKQLRSQDTTNLQITKPKSASGVRYIPMSMEAARAFRNIIGKQQEHKVCPMLDGFVGFIHLTTWGSIKTQHNFELQLRKISKAFNEANGTSLMVTPHVLRHTFCTNMIRAGADVKSVQYLMGHAKADITLNTYTHYDYEDAKAVFDVIQSKAMA